MESQSPPSKIARFADSVTGNGVVGTTTITTSIGLDLELGPLVTHDGKPVFTFLQLQELEHQALIYKYMAAGMPVPSHLVLPIWKSLGSTYAGTGIYPSFLGCRGVCFDYRNSMEPEPGRCRRTDGKKWRCAKDVVPDQKYCERHMHRGRNRSRKHVETTSMAASSSNVNVSSNNLSISVPQLLLMDTPTNTTPNNNNNNSSNNCSDVSPKSVLHESGGTCKAESQE